MATRHGDSVVVTLTVKATTCLSVDIVRAAQGGDAAAREQIIERYANLVWWTVRGFRLPHSDTHDAVQNTWLAMLEHLEQLHDPYRLPGWLVTTARRQCLNLLRRGNREFCGIEDSMLDRPDDRDPGPETVITRRRMNATLWSHVESLPPRGRTLLLALTAHDAPRYAELARATGIPIGSIGPTRMRYLRKLRRRLEESGLGAQSWW